MASKVAPVPAVLGSQVTGRHNGITRPDTPAMLSQLAQFDKLIALRDEISRGTHPRLKLSATASTLSSGGPNSHTPNSSQTPRDHTSSSTPAIIASAPGTRSIQKMGTQAPSHERGEHGDRPPRASKSDFDPILLTKSEHLKRAEKRLERQRVERALDEQIQNRKTYEKREVEHQEARAEFDVSEVLAQALELVKPLSASDANAANLNGSASDSIDNNTLYSSQANESETEDRADLRATKPCRYYFVEGRCLKGDRCDWSHDPAFKRKMQDPQAMSTNNYFTETDSQTHRRPPARSTSAVRPGGSNSYPAEDGEIEESSYSPPRVPPIPLTSEGTAPTHLTATARVGAHRVNHVYENMDAPSRRSSGRFSPSGDGRVVRSHIISPIAPQPSRVSPFAVAKMTRVERVRQAAEEQTPRSQRQLDSTGQSSGSESLAITKKRRRGTSPNGENRNVAQRRQHDSPQPIIKAEPLSPGPLSQYPARAYHEDAGALAPGGRYRPNQQPMQRVVYEDNLPTTRGRVYLESDEVYRLSPPSSRRVVSGPAGPMVYSARPPVRVHSPQESFGHRGPSAAGPREAYVHNEYFQPPSSSQRRPMSRATVIELDAAPPAPVYRASVQPQSSYARPTQYSPAEPEPRAMAPPARRIVMDQYGNRYYETPVMPERRASQLPEPRYTADAAPRRASARPELGRIYSDPYAQHASPAPPSPTYVEYREIQPPPPPPSHPPRTTSRISHAPVYERGRADEPYRVRPVTASFAGQRYDDSHVSHMEPPLASQHVSSAIPQPSPHYYYDDVTPRRADDANTIQHIPAEREPGRSYYIPVQDPDVEAVESSIYERGVGGRSSYEGAQGRVRRAYEPPVVERRVYRSEYE